MLAWRRGSLPPAPQSDDGGDPSSAIEPRRWPKAIPKMKRPSMYMIVCPGRPVRWLRSRRLYSDSPDPSDSKNVGAHLCTMTFHAYHSNNRNRVFLSAMASSHAFEEARRDQASAAGNSSPPGPPARNCVFRRRPVWSWVLRPAPRQGR